MKQNNLKHSSLIIGVSAIFAAIIGYITGLFIPGSEYHCSSRFYITNNTSSSETELQNQDLLNESLNFFISSYTFMDIVSEKSALDYNAKDLQSMVNIKPADAEGFYDIIITAKNPSDAFQIQQALQNNFSKYVEDTTNGKISVKLTDEAQFNNKPVYPYLFTITIIFTAIGIGAGVFIALKSIKKARIAYINSDITEGFGYPTITEIPLCLIPDKESKRNKLTTPDKILIVDSKNPEITEAFKKLYAAVKFKSDNPCAVITICGNITGEGTTTAAVNLAIAAADDGMRVLLIDYNFRKGNINKYFHLSERIPGISNVIYGSLKAKDAIISANYKSLSLITAGTIISNPLSILTNPDLTKTVFTLRSMFDYIIIDTPPVNDVSDALPLAEISDAVLLTVRKGFTEHEDIERTVKSFRLSDIQFDGFIVNGIEYI